MLEAVASWFIVLWGWRRLLVAVIAGALSALALPPFDAFPVLFLTFPVLVWLLDGTTASRNGSRIRSFLAAALVGWGFGFGYFLAGLWWVGAAFLVDADIFGWMMPFAVVALPAGLALFTAGGTALARLLWSGSARRIFALSLGLGLSELARGHLFTGFPWNSFGYALTASPVLMQAGALIGLYGLTLLAIFIFASPAALVSAGSRAGRFVVPGLALIALMGLVGHGAHRLAGGAVEELDLSLRIVQPSIDQSQKWVYENRSEIFTRYLELSDSATSPDSMGIADVDLLVWPESALPFVFEAEPAALPAIAAMLPQGTTLVTGMQTAEADPAAPDGYRIYNSVLKIDGEGRIEDGYDKVRLVPFGEFLPFQALLESVGLQQLTQVAGGFSAGSRPGMIELDGGLRFQPLICYEIIFPGAVSGDEERPDFILNVTNDSWFGDSPGPWQHLRQARLRAVEEGLPVIRAANTGISAVIDPYGRLLSRLGLNVRGVLDSNLPAAIEPTPFRRWGNAALAALIAIFALAALPRKIV